MYADDAPAPVHTALDLSAAVTSGWVAQTDLPPGEFARAERFYRSIHRHDDRLIGIRTTAVEEVRRLTGADAYDIGSFGLGVNLEASDLDLGMAWPETSRDELRARLAPGFAYQGDRATRFANRRSVFATVRDGVEVDVTVLAPDDFVTAWRMHAQIAERMTDAERVVFTWVKHLLSTSGRTAEYGTWKSAPYRRFCEGYQSSVEETT